MTFFESGSHRCDVCGRPVSDYATSQDLCEPCFKACKDALEQRFYLDQYYRIWAGVFSAGVKPNEISIESVHKAYANLKTRFEESGLVFPKTPEVRFSENDRVEASKLYMFPPPRLICGPGCTVNMPLKIEYGEDDGDET